MKRIRVFIYVVTGWQHHPFIGWYRPDGRQLPFCEQCGGHNLILLDEGWIWAPDSMHVGECPAPRQHRVSERYVRRYGIRAARRQWRVML